MKKQKSSHIVYNDYFIKIGGKKIKRGKEYSDKIEYVVFGIDHYNALGIIRGLGEDGIDVNAIIVKSRKKCVIYSRYIIKLYTVDNVEAGYNVLLEVFGNSEKKIAILCGDDIVVSCLDMHYDSLKDNFVFFNAGQSGKLTKYMDKRFIAETAQQVGFDVPKTWEIERGIIPDDIIYPVITKAESSIRGAWKADVHVCYNEEELKRAFQLIKSEIVVLQQYIEKENELALQGYSLNRGEDAYISVYTNNEYILPGKYCSYIRVKKFIDLDLEKKCRKLLSFIGYEGIFEIEFIVKGDKLYFLEVNFRNTAFNYASKLAGANLNKTWPVAMLEREHIPDMPIKDELNFTIMAEPQDFKDRVRTKNVSLLKWIIQALKCDKYFYFNWKDLKPAIFYWL